MRILKLLKNKPIEKVGEIRDDTEQKVGKLAADPVKGSWLNASFSYFVYMLRRHKTYDIQFNS